MLERRPLDLPRVDLHGRSIREYGIAGRCVEGSGVPVNAIVLPRIPGVAALGPVGERERYWPVLRLSPKERHASCFSPDCRGLAIRAGGSSGRSGSATRATTGRCSCAAGDWIVSACSASAMTSPAQESAATGGRVVGNRYRLAGGRIRRDAGWRVTAVPTLIRSPGCYAFKVDGLEFSYVLAFGVQAA